MARAPERGWADANPLARSTKEMGPGFRRDTMDNHFNDWNHKKIIALGYVMRRKVENVVQERMRTREALADMDKSLGTRGGKEMDGNGGEVGGQYQRPQPLPRRCAKTSTWHGCGRNWRQRWRRGRWQEKRTLGQSRVTCTSPELIAMGLQLEDQHLHPTDGQRRAMIERTSKLRRKIVAWAEVQQKFFPALVNIREQGQSIPGLRVSDIPLWLPSVVAAALEPDVEGVTVTKAVQEHEYWLCVWQANEALHELRRLLLGRTHLYKLKDTHSRGVRGEYALGGQDCSSE
ncbi:hypothetical protein B0H14DRAFT_2637253 [Mycena olivaceomarginata]|nr:hypothetical protein B0H14DRAFT_2637253 [Mycena olivaceomarginata]